MPTLSPYKHRELKRGADDLLPGEAPKKHRSLPEPVAGQAQPGLDVPPGGLERKRRPSPLCEDLQQQPDGTSKRAHAAACVHLLTGEGLERDEAAAMPAPLPGAPALQLDLAHPSADEDQGCPMDMEWAATVFDSLKLEGSQGAAAGQPRTPPQPTGVPTQQATARSQGFLNREWNRVKSVVSHQNA